jgi:type IV secretion system protein VirB9
MTRNSVLIVAVLTGLLAPTLRAQNLPAAAPAATSVKSADSAATLKPEAKPPDNSSTGAELTATVVRYGERDVIRLKAKLRYTTLLVLPKNEQILDFTCGDKEFWIVNGSQNFAYVKPARANSQTNLNLIAASGNVYSFVLSEISGSPGMEPDLKVFVEPKEGEVTSALNGAPRFVAASEVDNYRQQIEMAKEETRQARQQAQAMVEQQLSTFRSEYPTGLKFSYHFEHDRKPFQVAAMYHDDRFTYIQANPQETPALYELKDGKPNLINFDYRNGTYIVGKVLDSGYLAIGKARMTFTRQESAPRNTY